MHHVVSEWSRCEKVSTFKLLFRNNCVGVTEDTRPPSQQRERSPTSPLKQRETMSSGFGIRGGIGRCYPFFAEYKTCLVSPLVLRRLLLDGRMLIWASGMTWDLCFGTCRGGIYLVKRRYLLGSRPVFHQWFVIVLFVSFIMNHSSLFYGSRGGDTYYSAVQPASPFTISTPNEIRHHYYLPHTIHIVFWPFFLFQIENRLRRIRNREQFVCQCVRITLNACTTIKNTVGFVRSWNNKKRMRSWLNQAMMEGID